LFLKNGEKGDRKSLISSAFFTAVGGLAVSFMLIKEYGIYGSPLKKLLK
jgi:hypothetical protein